MCAMARAKARHEVRRIHGEQPTPFFKLFYAAGPAGSPHLSHEAFVAALEEAHTLGMRVDVHPGTVADYIAAVEAGADLLMHAPNDGLLTDEDLTRLVKLKTPFVPTLRAFAYSTEACRGKWVPVEEAHVPQEIRDVFLRPTKRFQHLDLADWSQDFARNNHDLQANAARMVAAGIPYFAGTDTGVSGQFPGVALHVELERMVEMGLSPVDVLKSATSAPAAFLDPTGSIGRVAPGQRADLLLVRRDPTQDITATARLLGIWVEGRFVEPWGTD